MPLPALVRRRYCSKSWYVIWDNARDEFPRNTTSRTLAFVPSDKEFFQTSSVSANARYYWVSPRSFLLSSSLKRERNLLGVAYDWESNARPASFDDVRRRHQALPANQLARVTAQYLRQQQLAGSATGSSSGTAIVVAEHPRSLSGPGAARSLLSRVEPFGHDREANEVCVSAYVLHIFLFLQTAYSYT